MNLVPIEKIAKHTIIEVSDIKGSYISGGLILAENVSLGNDIVCIGRAIVKEIATKEKTIPTLSTYDWHCGSSVIEASVEYGAERSGIILPKSRILSMVMVDDMDDYPKTREWSSRTKQQAEELCNEKVKQEHDRYLSELPAKIIEVEAKWKHALAKDAAREEWKNVSWFKRLFKKPEEFICDRADRIQGDMYPAEFYADLSKAGINYAMVMKK